MNFRLLSADLVVRLHYLVLNPGELPGLARHKSLKGALARVGNRLAYGLIGDVLALAAAYASAIGQGHCFNDENKRTAFRAMQMCLFLNAIDLPAAPDAKIGDLIIRLAQRKMAICRTGCANGRSLRPADPRCPAPPALPQCRPQEQNEGSDG